jgi:hypothetical protein
MPAKDVPVAPTPWWLYGSATLCACNFVLGHMMAFPESYFTFAMVNEFSPTVVQLMYCIMFVPWVFKPVYAVYIDRGDMSLRVYIHLLLPLIALGWGTMMIVDHIAYSMVMLALNGVGMSIVDVALDTLMVRTAKTSSNATTTQLHVAVARCTGMLVGVYNGGVVMHAFGNRGVFAALMLQCLAFACMAYLLIDVYSGRPTAPSKKHVFSGNVLRVFAFVSILHSVPDVNGLMDFVLLDTFRFSASTIGALDMIGYIAMLFSSSVYSAYVGTKCDDRRLVAVMLVVAALACLIPVTLLRGDLPADQVSPVTVVAVYTFVRSAALRLVIFPINAVVLNQCTIGYEGTVYATYTAVLNLSGIVGMLASAGLAWILGLRRHEMDALWIAYSVRVGLLVCLLPLVLMLPRRGQAVQVTFADDDENDTEADNNP